MKRGVVEALVSFGDTGKVRGVFRGSWAGSNGFDGVGISREADTIVSEEEWTGEKREQRTHMPNAQI